MLYCNCPHDLVETKRFGLQSVGNPLPFYPRCRVGAPIDELNLKDSDLVGRPTKLAAGKVREPRLRWLERPGEVFVFAAGSGVWQKEVR